MDVEQCYVRFKKKNQNYWEYFWNVFIIIGKENPLKLKNYFFSIDIESNVVILLSTRFIKSKFPMCKINKNRTIFLQFTALTLEQGKVKIPLFVSFPL